MTTTKLSYRITGRRQMDGDQLNLNHVQVDVEWRRADGGEFKHFHNVPVTHPPHVKYDRQLCGTSLVLFDQVNVPAGCPDSVVMQILEEKRPRIEAAYGL